MMAIPIEQERPLDLDTELDPEFELDEYQDAELADWETADLEAADFEDQPELDGLAGEEPLFEADEEFGRRVRPFPARAIRRARLQPRRRPRWPRPGIAARAPAPPAGGEGSEFARWVQDTLNRIMGTRLAVTGVIGPRTRQAIRSFQSRQGLPATGIVGPDTQRALLGASAPGAATDPDGASGAADSELSWMSEADGGTIPVGPLPLAYPPGCPAPDIVTITGYPRNRFRVSDLPSTEQQLLDRVVELVRRSRRSGCREFTRITITGRATSDERATTGRLRAASAARLLRARLGRRVQLVPRQERVQAAPRTGPADPNVRLRSIRITVGHR